MRCSTWGKSFALVMRYQRGDGATVGFKLSRRLARILFFNLKAKSK